MSSAAAAEQTLLSQVQANEVAGVILSSAAEIKSSSSAADRSSLSQAVLDGVNLKR